MLAAVSSVGPHRTGPVGEGRVIDGCVTCPWHGYQYSPDTGASPPPFTEKIPTFNVKIVDGQVWVDPRPNPAGTRVAVTGAGPCVFRAAEMEAALGGGFSAAALDGASVPADDFNSDIHASAEYRAHLVGVMARRAVAAAG